MVQEFSPENLCKFSRVRIVFLARWGEKKNPLQILAKYNNLKIQPRESSQDFSTRFNKFYNSILSKIKPPLGLALLHYSDAFDLEMAYHLRERNSTKLEDMKNNAVHVEANLLAKKLNLKSKKRFIIKEDPATSSDAKFKKLVKTMEKMMEKISLAIWTTI